MHLQYKIVEVANVKISKTNVFLTIMQMVKIYIHFTLKMSMMEYKGKYCLWLSIGTLLWQDFFVIFGVFFYLRQLLL